MPADAGRGGDDQGDGPEEVADRAEEVRAGNCGRSVVARDVDERELGSVAHRGGRATERERRDHEQRERLGHAVQRERGRKSECTRAGDDAATAVVGEDREDGPDDRAGRSRDEHGARLRVAESEVRAERLEGARGQEAGELVDQTDGEEGDEEAPSDARCRLGSVVRRAGHGRTA